jgi:hypothetical protein
VLSEDVNFVQSITLSSTASFVVSAASDDDEEESNIFDSDRDYDDDL